ncbi:hypothetical protein BT67DRAFT_121594 [Trichocladium antarcticum]|uniref:Uncharacterized protein n=1 Tax=Trichocladium antarcticum TaxID=1450529 RepID=A0AAN6ZG07_9PEZI|nr:hypothetical protein BT67DRAFT_121594 [Trichocladium antarcticum]
MGPASNSTLRLQMTLHNVCSIGQTHVWVSKQSMPKGWPRPRTWSKRLLCPAHAGIHTETSVNMLSHERYFLCPPLPHYPLPQTSKNKRNKTHSSAQPLHPVAVPSFAPSIRPPIHYPPSRCTTNAVPAGNHGRIISHHCMQVFSCSSQIMRRRQCVKPGEKSKRI